MRNWNYDLTEEEIKIIELRAYLWGIETPLKTWLHSLQGVRCEPTYEELKHLYMQHSNQIF